MSELTGAAPEPAGMDCEFFTPSCDPASFWLFLGVCILLVTAAGLMAGLTMGLLSLDMLNMRILEMEGSPAEKKSAARVIPVVSHHHLLLVTLLLVNAGANEALPIFLSKLVPESVSIILSVTCVLIFGEILPSAVFTGPNQLSIAAALTPLVRGLMAVTSPISYPIAKCLDKFLGADHEIMRYKRREIKALVALQRSTDELRRTYLHSQSTLSQNGTQPNHSAPSPRLRPRTDSSSSVESYSDFVRESPLQSTRLNVDEVTIIHGALDLSAKTAREVMIPINQVYMLECDTKLNELVMADILASGHSRIPIYKEYRSNIIGLLLVKRLIVVDPEDCRPIRDLVHRKKPIVVTPQESCYHILNEFQKGRSHIAFVTTGARQVTQCWRDGVDIPKDEVTFVGIVTIEDVIEELIQEEIEDESDLYVHGIVNYWKAKAGRKVRQAGKTAFVKKRLQALAEQARTRVKSRGAQKKPTAAVGGKNMEDALQIRVVSEKSPLLPTTTPGTK